MLREWRQRQCVQQVPLGEDLVEKYLLEDEAFIEYEAKRAKRRAYLAHLPTQLLLYVTSAHTCRADVIVEHLARRVFVLNDARRSHARRRRA